MTATHFTALVIGGGPAGSAAATTLARAGIRTGLVDKSAFPRHKLCGGLLTLRSQRAFESTFGSGWEHAHEVECHGLRLMQNNTLLNEVADHSAVCFTQRRHFDHLLLQRAQQQGTELLLGDGVQAIDLAGKTCTLRSGQVMSYDHLVGCDGVNSVVAKAIFGSSFDARGIGFALETDIDAAQLDQTFPVPEVHFGVVRWGYGWIFPKRGAITIGLGGLQRKNADMRPLLTRFIEQTTGLSSGYRIKGHHIPFGDFRKTPGAPGVLLAGDAAGLVDPITGEGIAFAMQSGALAAQAIQAAIAAPGQVDTLQDYTRSLQPVFSAIGYGKTLRNLIFPAPMERLFTRALPRSTRTPRLHMDLLSGAIEYPAYTRQLLGRLLPAALRH